MEVANITRAKKQFKLLGIFNHIIAQTSLYIAIILLIVMTCSVMLQIISRSLRSPIGWTEEVAVLSMAWIAFLIAPYAYRHHLFTRIEILIDHLNFPLRMTLQLILHIMEFCIICIGLYYAMIFFEGSRGNSVVLTSILRSIASIFMDAPALASIYVKTKWTYIIVPIGFFFMIFVAIEHILRTIASLIASTDLTTNILLNLEHGQPQEEQER